MSSAGSAKGSQAITGSLSGPGSQSDHDKCIVQLIQATVLSAGSAAGVTSLCRITRSKARMANFTLRGQAHAHTDLGQRSVHRQMTEERVTHIQVNNTQAHEFSASGQGIYRFHDLSMKQTGLQVSLSPKYTLAESGAWRIPASPRLGEA